ncbi:hypothetical protein RHMOL_Rhmol11G0095200 [Rhododendron molle]|uniref:Uncharacterized protein n=1 Tax=Rhododendron molle TaxID=49168 RepID=A0ACC0LQA7_RHOML|nr:hypothetical protein RHMOL_Rhmol11G0095200 [Rhododendron molle]
MVLLVKTCKSDADGGSDDFVGDALTFFKQSCEFRLKTNTSIDGVKNRFDFVRERLVHTLSIGIEAWDILFRSSFCLSTMATPSCPKFIPVEHSGIASISKPDGFKFRLVSYNILAQAYAKSEQFPHSPSPCRKWKTRSQAILTLLKGLEADFLCLQEVDEYDSFYKGNLESHGYASVYIQRSRKKPDGCGIFYKHNNVELILEEKIEYNDLVISFQDETTAPLDTDNDALAVGNEDTEQRDGLTQKDNDGHRGDPNDPRVRLKRDCVGIMAAFKLKDPSQHVVIVANTHLYWDPNWADVKLAQAKYLLARLAQFKILVSDKFECSPSVIVGGDFNSTLGDKYSILGYPLISVHFVKLVSKSWYNDDVFLINISCMPGLNEGLEPFTYHFMRFEGLRAYMFLLARLLVACVDIFCKPFSTSSQICTGCPDFTPCSLLRPLRGRFCRLGLLRVFHPLLSSLLIFILICLLP